MNCHEVEKRLPLFLEPDLPEVQKSEIREHLSSCPACAEKARKLESTWRLLGQWPEAEPSPQFKQRVWVRIDEIEEKRRAKKWTFALGGWGWRVAWLPVGSLAAALLLILTWVYWSSYRKDITTTADSQVGTLELILSLDLLEHKDILLEMELLEDFDVLLALEESPGNSGTEG